jgi:hypothetical protein
MALVRASVPGLRAFGEVFLGGLSVLVTVWIISSSAGSAFDRLILQTALTS